MPSTDAELTLVLKARNVASGPVDELADKVNKVGSEADKSGGRFGKLGEIIHAIPFGELIGIAVRLLSHWKPFRDMMEHVGQVIGEKLAPIMAKVADVVEKKVLPVLSRMIDIVGPILSKAIDAAAWAFEHVIVPAIETVIGILSTLINKIADAIHWLSQFNQQRTAAMDQAHLLGQANPVGQHAAGGWVGLNGPELAVLGERGPEYVVPNNKLGGSSDYEMVPVRKKDLMRMVDEQMYFTLRRAAPTSGRV